MSTLKTAVVQASSTPDVKHNLKWVEEAFQQAKDQACQLIVFPECILCWAAGDATRKNSRSLQEWEKIILPLQKKYGITSVWGGVPILEDGNIYNTSLVYSPEGKLLALYEKTHLFQLFIKDKITVDETETYAFGRTGAVSFKIGDFEIGLTICYDLRFPELFRQYEGADVIVCTAAFTKKTGRAHWEVLLRARAIENQCYILGSAQCGINELNGIHTYGHSLIIDSWGKVVKEAKDKPTVIVAELNKKEILNNRELLPALKNRRVK